MADWYCIEYLLSPYVAVGLPALPVVCPVPVVEEYLQQKRKGIQGGILLVLRIILQGVLPRI